MDGERAVPGVRTRDAFAVPAAEAVRECPAWDSYGSGMNGLDAQWSYLATVGAERMRRQFGARDVIYLLGMNDTDAEASDLARGCAAMLQGAHRLERGITYFNHIDRYYLERGGHRHRIGFVPRVGHDHAGIWGSDEGLLHIFDHWRWGTAAR
jgi:hypothetical protein